MYCNLLHLMSTQCCLCFKNGRHPQTNPTHTAMLRPSFIKVWMQRFMLKQHSWIWLLQKRWDLQSLMFSNYYQTHISHSRMLMQVRIGQLVLARNVANYVGHSIMPTKSQKVWILYYQVLTVPSFLGFLHLGSLTVSCLNFETSCLPLHARQLFQVIPDTALLAPPQVISILLWPKIMSQGLSTLY